MKQQSKRDKQNTKDKKNSKSKPRESNKIKVQRQPEPKIQHKKPQHQLQNLPTIQNLLQIPAEKRGQKSLELFTKVEPFLHNYMQKKQGSRVVQLLFKWGPNKEVKQKIFDCVSKHWKDLIKSKYALYVIAKVIAEKEFSLDQVVNDCVSLMQGRQSAQVLQNYVKNNPQSPQVRQIKQKFIELSQKAQQEMKAEQALQNIAVKIVQKQYHTFMISKLVLRLALPKMFEEQKQKALQFLTEKVAGIVDDEEGVRLFIELLNSCNAKQKKSIIKLYKGNINEIVGFNNVSYVSIVKLLLETDDTVYLIKTFGEEILNLLSQATTCKKSFSIVFALFSPRNHNFNVLGKYEPHVAHTQCKKPEEERKKELRMSLYPAIAHFLTDSDSQALREVLKLFKESKLIVGIIRSMLDDQYPQTKKFINNFVDVYVTELKQLEKQKSVKKDNFASLLISDPSAHKVLKNILSIQNDAIEPQCDKVAQLLVKHIDEVLKSKASFILLGLVEKGGRSWLLDQIKNSSVRVSESVAGQHYAKLIEDKPAGSKGDQSKSQSKQNVQQKHQQKHKN